MDQVLYYDCFCGISGDMHIGAMIDLGVPEAFLRDQLAKLPNHAEFELSLDADTRKGISGTRATVVIDEQAPKPHRHLRHIAEIVQSAGYEPAVEQLALDIFTHLADAEGDVHNVPKEAVHFHEVGATDAIVDIVAAAACVHYLSPSRVFVGPIEVGSGTVRCEHGLMPVPAPATAALLKGMPCHYGRVNGEATTPTGAAILKAIATDFTPPEQFTAQALGYGVGQKDFEVANILRVSRGVLREPGNTAAAYLRETNLEMVSNIDDMTPEAAALLLSELWQAGALDVDLVATQMKKQRTGFKLTVLMQPSSLDELMTALFRHSTSIGVRVHEVHKWMLPRREESIDTSLGTVRVKIVTHSDGQVRYKIEHDDVLACCNQETSYLQAQEQLSHEVGVWFRQRSQAKAQAK